MSTDWRSGDVARRFDAYDDLPERVIGYPSVFAALGLDAAARGTYLDYGCGPGKVAARVVRRCEACRVTAVDISPAMLAIARSERSHPRIDYREVDAGGLDWVADATVDGAMSCYVFINIGSLDVIRGIVAEVHRVLRPGARYAILDTNPNTTGVDFSTFRSGTPGRRYGAGEQREVRLRIDGEPDLVLHDHHWPTEVYREVLVEAGFATVDVLQPLLGDVAAGTAVDHGPAGGPALAAESERPPFQVVVARKAGAGEEAGAGDRAGAAGASP